MPETTLYHGSTAEVGQPIFGKGRPYNDFGLGFYCTEDVGLARPEYGLLSWLSVLLQNRGIELWTPLMKQGGRYLLEHFLPDLSEADVIIGYRADDSYFAFARAFLSNQISMRQLGLAMRQGKPVDQVVLKSERAFQAIQFKGAELVESAVYFEKRTKRDQAARLAFREELSRMDAGDALYIRDLLREGVRPGDPRLL